MPLPPGDLTGDRLVDIQDWIAFKATANTSLTGVSNEMAIMLGDLNLDRVHSLSDVRLFRQYFDEALRRRRVRGDPEYPRAGDPAASRHGSVFAARCGLVSDAPGRGAGGCAAF